MDGIRKLIFEDMKPALGVTEPAAIALACARARSLSNEPVKKLRLRVNSGIYKNAFTCGIPGTDKVGNEYSAALGLVCGSWEKGLCVLEDVDAAAVEAAQALIDKGMIEVEMAFVSSELYIEARLETEQDLCIAIIQGGHENFCHMEKNSQVLFHKDYVPAAESDSPLKEMSFYQLIDFALNVPVEKLHFIRDAYLMNTALAEAGADWERCVIAAELIRSNGGFYSKDAEQSAKALACAAAEARVLGIDRPAMSITGSGTHGIICTLPIEAYCRVEGIDEARKLRATAISYLLTMYVKEYSGKLSAFCGCGVAGGTGLACALTYLMGGSRENCALAVSNLAASITGMICTGGNHCCCLKVTAAVGAAFSAARLAARGISVSPGHGICAMSPEKTMQNMGLIAVPGMVQTEKTITDILQNC